MPPRQNLISRGTTPGLTTSATFKALCNIPLQDFVNSLRKVSRATDSFGIFLFTLTPFPLVKRVPYLFFGPRPSLYRLFNLFSRYAGTPADYLIYHCISLSLFVSGAWNANQFAIFHPQRLFKCKLTTDSTGNGCEATRLLLNLVLKNLAYIQKIFIRHAENPIQ